MVRRYSAFLFLVLCAAARAQQDPEELLKEAIRLHQAGQAERAIPQYRAYLKLRPDSAMAHSNLGAALAGAGLYDDAIIEYKQAFETTKDPRIRLNLALAYYKAGRIPEAVRELGALHAVQPDNRQVTLLLADCRLREGEDAKVIELLTPVEQRDPNDLAVSYMLGMALLRSHQIERGQKMIDRILSRGDSAEARLMMGTAKLNALDYPAAIADLEKAAELNPHLPDVYAHLGKAQMDNGNLPAARAAFEKELQQNPNDFESNLNLAVLLKQDQDYDGARKLLDRALRVRPGHLAALYQVAAIDLATGKLDTARLNLERIIKSAPDFEEAHIQLATIYYRQKRRADGDRERAVAQKLSAEKQAREAAKK